MLSYETTIEDILHHTQNKYRYRGEEGKEYQVIQSVFCELNRVTHLSNKYIRWYTVIIFLSNHFRRLHDQSFLAEALPQELIDLSICHQTRIPKGKQHRVFIPSYIECLETYLKHIARLGILISTKMKIQQHYVDLKLNHINDILNELLKNMKSIDHNYTDEEIYLLAIQNATENIIKKTKYISKTLHNNAIQAATSHLYTEIITAKTKKIPKNRIKKLYNLDDFWNGFIP